MSTITDAQVEAAQTSLGHEAVYVGAPTVRRALEAAYLATTEPSKPVAEAVKVKPLEWEEQNPFVWDAADIYRIEDNGHITRNRYWLRILNNRTEHSSLEEAKAAAQADYEQRVMSALSTPPQPIEAGGENDPLHIRGSCEDPRLVSAGYVVCGSGANTQWHWHGPDGVWHDGFKSESAAVNSALRAIRNEGAK
jgi:hypothetical protein